MIIKIDDEPVLELCCAGDLAFADNVTDPKEWIVKTIENKAYLSAMKMIERWKCTLFQEDAELRAMSYEDAHAILKDPELAIPRIVECPSYKSKMERDLEGPLND